MTTYKIIINCVLGVLALSMFVNLVKLIKTQQNRGVVISYALMGTSICLGIMLDITQAFFLEGMTEKHIKIIQRLDANITGYFLGLVTFFLLFVKVQKENKTPNNRAIE